MITKNPNLAYTPDADHKSQGWVPQGFEDKKSWTWPWPWRPLAWPLPWKCWLRTHPCYILWNVVVSFWLL